MADDTAPPEPGEVKAGVAATFGAVATVYDTAIGFFAPFGRALVSTAGVSPGERLLDLACGAGAVLEPAVAAGATAMGVDLAPAMAARARAFAPTVAGDIEALPIADDSIDVVLCGFGVFFVPRPDHLVAEVRRVLRAGGRFAASTFATGAGGFSWSGSVVEALGLPAPALSTSPFIRAAGLRDALDVSGFTGSTTTTVEERFAFDGVEQYEAWFRSHGGRRLLVALDEQPDLLSRWRELSSQRLAADDHVLVQPVDLTVARRGPGAPASAGR